MKERSAENVFFLVRQGVQLGVHRFFWQVQWATCHRHSRRKLSSSSSFLFSIFTYVILDWQKKAMYCGAHLWQTGKDLVKVFPGSRNLSTENKTFTTSVQAKMLWFWTPDQDTSWPKTHERWTNIFFLQAACGYGCSVNINATLVLTCFKFEPC